MSTSQIHDLRTAFDQTFAQPANVVSHGHVDLIRVVVAGQVYAIRLGDVVGLRPAKKIVPVPSAVPEFLGVASLRGDLISVYHLGLLLGHRPAPSALPWLALCAAGELIGLAFEMADGHLRVSKSDLLEPGPREAAREHVREVARVGPTLIPVIEIQAVVETIKRRADAVRLGDETKK